MFYHDETRFKRGISVRSDRPSRSLVVDAMRFFPIAIGGPLVALAVGLSASGLDRFWRIHTRHNLGLWIAVPVAMAVHGLWLCLAIERRRHVAGVGAWMVATALSTIGLTEAGFTHGGWTWAVALQSLALGATIVVTPAPRTRAASADQWVRESARLISQALESSQSPRSFGGRS